MHNVINTESQLMRKAKPNPNCSVNLYSRVEFNTTECAAIRSQCVTVLLTYERYTLHSYYSFVTNMFSVKENLSR